MYDGGEEIVYETAISDHPANIEWHQLVRRWP